jgi:type II secretory pathway pseudopilin PulG
VLTELGESLTQASFMVKNNDKQYQRFRLPEGAKFWSCYVNNQPAKPERDGDWLLVPLPRGVNRDEAFAVDIVYAETNAPLKSPASSTLKFTAPRTDVPNTYAEWELYAPTTFRLSAFGGSMTVARGTTYGLHDAWQEFIAFYARILRESSGALVFIVVVVVLVASLIAFGIRRRTFTFIGLLIAIAVLGIFAALLLPATSRSKMKAQRISALGNLKQVGLAAQAEAVRKQQLTTVSAGKPRESLRGVFQQDVAGYVNASQPPISGETGIGGAGGGGFSGAIAPGEPAPAAQPMAAGIRSIRIDIPRAGQAFVFTKVLNVRDEPLSIQARVVELKTFQAMRMIGQLTVFLAGLVVWLWQWRRIQRNSFLLTVGLALILGAVGSLLIEWRVLHVAFIAGVLIVALFVFIWLVRKFWPRRKPTGFGPQSSAVPPAIAAIALLLGVSRADARPIQTSRSDVAPVAASIISANYTGMINERVAQLDVTVRVVATKPGQRVTLFGDDVAMQQFSGAPKDAKLIREGGNVAVILPQKGEATLQMKLLAKVGGDVSKRLLSFRVPGALTSLMDAMIDQPEADVEFPSAVSFKCTAAGQQTRVEAVIASGERIELRWTPRVKRAAEIAATVICQNVVMAKFGGGVVNTRATLDYRAVQGELHQLRVRLPAAHRLLRVEGEFIRTWDVKDEAGPVLAVELIKGVTPEYRLTVETETVLGALPATVAVETPHALDVKRETGVVALRSDEDLELSVESAEGLQRVDAEEFARASGQSAGGVLNAFRFLKPEFSLRARAAAVQPQIEAQIHNHVTVGAEQISVSAVVNYTIKRAGVFSLKLALPVGYGVENVGGANVLQWAERTDDGTPVLEVTLKERTSGDYALRVDLVSRFKELPKTLAIAGVHPQNAQKLTGFILVSTEPGVAVKTAAFDGLTEIPVAVLENSVGTAMSPVDASSQRVPSRGGGSSALAFKFVATEPQPAASWKLELATEALVPWLRAEIANTFTVTETLVGGRALVRYDIQNAPTKELRLRIPAAFKNVEISGANIRRRDQDGEIWRVELQNKVRGFHTLTLKWEQPRAAASSRLELGGVSADGVERETGLVAVVAQPPLQVTEAGVTNLLRVDARDWPDWAGRADGATVLAYRYLRAGYRLALDARRFDEAEVLQALVESAQLSTVVADDGQTMTVMSLAVRNNGRQFLEVGLPPGTTKAWSAFVAGQAVRPSLRGDELMVPLEQSGAGGAPVSVELTFVGTNQFPKQRGAVTFVSPQLDLPLRGARWELFLPPDYDYSDFDRGTMKPERGGMPERVSFSFGEYAQQETRKKTLSEIGWKSEVSNAKMKIAEGDIKEAYRGYNRARSIFYNDKQDKDLKELGDELRRIQSSNLVQAQSDFSGANNAAQVPVQGAAAAPQQITLYDSATAEAQWTKLQQAQESAAAKVAPLHVNLPTRGLRYAFTQVLQTEIGKPMTIQMTVANTKSANWPTRIALAVVGFLLLWIAVAVTAKRTVAAGRTA